MTPPKFRFLQVVEVHWETEQGEPCIDRGRIVGINAKFPHWHREGIWVYVVEFFDMPRQPELVPYLEPMEEDELLGCNTPNSSQGCDQREHPVGA